MKLLLAAVAVAAFPSLAMAQDVPRYDPETHCDNVAGDSSRLYNHCIESEQESYDAVKRAWANVPERPRSHCADIADSYRLLEHCLKRETEADENRSGFSFD